MRLFPAALSRHRELRTSAYRTIVVSAIGVLVVGVTVAGVFARSLSLRNESDYQARLDQDALAIAAQINEEMTAYGTLLRAGSAQFALAPTMTASDWNRFADAMNLPQQYSSVLGFGYSKRVSAEEAVTTGVWPTGNREEYTRITYLVPESKENKKAIGYDMFSEPIRQAAMATARDNATITMSKPVHLVQDSGKQSLLGVLIYCPLYNNGEIPASTEERRRELVGYTYMVVRPRDVMSTVVSHASQMNATVDITLYEKQHNTLLYSATHSQTNSTSQARVRKEVNAYGQGWEITVAGRDEATSELYGPLGLFFLGSLFSALLAFGLFYVLTRRLTTVEKDLEEDVENTKSELLALASHQLRTPASGVKQYVGMLRDGTFGSLTPAQQALADKAYATNERQLHVINDLLYVSKVETGQLRIDPVPADITRITYDVVASMKPQAKQKNITIVFKTKKPHPVVADDRYVAMIVENLVSNAIKYSHPGSKVQVSIVAQDGAVMVKVTDKGVGIAKEDYERIFNKFDRVQNVLSHKEGGSGLGLFLARQLARGHGGDVTVTSEVDKGSCFVLTLPKTAMLDNEIVSLTTTQPKRK